MWSRRFRSRGAQRRRILHYMKPIPPPNHAESASLRMARQYIGLRVTLTIDRPYGTSHPVHGFRYEANYGYVPATLAPDGEELDAYLLGPTEPLDQAEGMCVGVIHRLDDDDDKLVVVPDGYQLTDSEILAAVAFQESPGRHRLFRS